tara:strand:- start:8 stop:1018 length:1011 start_codon:yes stop_codon:yes gene_type:complete
MSKLIKRDWRNWQPPSSSSYSEKLSNHGRTYAFKSPKLKPKITKDIPEPPINTIKTSKTPPKRLQNNKGGVKFNKNNLDLKLKNLPEHKIEQAIDNYDNNIQWSDHFDKKCKFNKNDKRTKSVFAIAEESKDKRLANTLAIMVSKLAEERSGDVIIGEDEWDLQELMMRGITKRNIYSCMQSRERENIVLILDSSPSCQSMSELYAKIALLSVKIGCLDIYLAPNAYVTHKMNNKSYEYEPIFDLNKDSSFIICGMDELQNFFKNRVILYFGDWDGEDMISKASKTNEIHWFNREYNLRTRHRFIDYIKEMKLIFDGAAYGCASREDLISITKTIR